MGFVFCYCSLTYPEFTFATHLNIIVESFGLRKRIRWNTNCGVTLQQSAADKLFIKLNCISNGKQITVREMYFVEISSFKPKKYFFYALGLNIFLTVLFWNVYIRQSSNDFDVRQMRLTLNSLRFAHLARSRNIHKILNIQGVRIRPDTISQPQRIM